MTIEPIANTASSRKMTRHSAGRQPRRHAAPLEPFEHRHQRDGDHQRGRHRHEEFGAGAQRERQGDEQPDPGDQGQRRQQPVALDRDAFGQHVRFVVGRRRLLLAWSERPSVPLRPYGALRWRPRYAIASVFLG